MRHKIEQIVSEHDCCQLPDSWADRQLLVANLLQTLAGPVATGTILMVGNRLPLLLPNILDGMNVAVQIVHCVDNPQLKAQLAPVYHLDVRLTLHCQDYATFLQDINQHRFDFVIAHLAADQQQLIQPLSQLLSSNGMLCILSDEISEHNLLEPELWNTLFIQESSVLLASHKVQKPQRGRRRKNRSID